MSLSEIEDTRPRRATTPPGHQSDRGLQPYPPRRATSPDTATPGPLNNVKGGDSSPSLSPDDSAVLAYTTHYYDYHHHRDHREGLRQRASSVSEPTAPEAGDDYEPHVAVAHSSRAAAGRPLPPTRRPLRRRDADQRGITAPPGRRSVTEHVDAPRSSAAHSADGRRAGQ